MNKIILNNLLPDVFKEEHIESDIWQKDVQLNAGETYLVDSISGKGKSTFCSYIFGYRNDYSGKLFYDNEEIKSFPLIAWDEIRTRKVSLLFQELRLFPELTVLENILLKNNMTGFKDLQQIKKMLQQLNIENKIDVKIGKISWGQQQRVAIIRALCQPYNFLILDEPISHLDDENAAIIATLVSEEAHSQGAGIITTSIGKHLPLNYTRTFAL
ncbi:MAG: ATP-binding cassette domain-containing protein [Dysgonomonas sp.]